LIFGTVHPVGMEIQDCENEVPWFMHGPILGAYTSTEIYIKKGNAKQSSFQELLHTVGQYLAMDILRTRRFKFIQINSLGV